MQPSRSTQLVWLYRQDTGSLYLADDQDGVTFVARGYSGAAGHVNRTESEHIVAKGPIPRGLWGMDPPADHKRLGPLAIGLEAADPQAALKRSGFFVHGDNRAANGSASSGCIILDRATRALMVNMYWSHNLRSISVE